MIYSDHPYVTVAQDINTYMKTTIHKFTSMLYIVIDQLDYLFPKGHLLFWFSIAFHS